MGRLGSLVEFRLGRLVKDFLGFEYWACSIFVGDLAIDPGEVQRVLELEVFDAVAQVVELGFVPDDIGKDIEHCQRCDSSRDEECNNHACGKCDHGEIDRLLM